MSRDNRYNGYDDRYAADPYQDGYVDDVGYDDAYAEEAYESDAYGYPEYYEGDGYYEEDYYEQDDRSYRKNTRSKNTSRKKSQKSSRRQSSSGKKRGGSKRRKQQSIAPVFITVLLIVLLGGTFGMKLFLDKYSYSKVEADLDSYFAITADDDIPITWNHELSEIRAKKIDGTYYLPLSSVQAKLNDRFYYGVQNNDDTTGMIMYALPTEKVVAPVGSSEIRIGETSESKSYVPAVRDGDVVYLALDFVKEYTNFSFSSFDAPDRLVITTAWDPYTTATINKHTQIRTSGGIKSDVLEQLEKGEAVAVLDQMDEWSKVASADGFIGYVENKRMSDVKETTPTPVTDYVEPTYELHQLGQKVNMAYHNVYSTAAAQDTLGQYIAKTKTVNVVAPTIFWVTSEAGDMSSFASQQYVDQAHALGLKVWAVVDNINAPELTNKSTFLHTQESRDHLIDQLMSQVTTFGYDGINVDFELIDSAYGQDYIEFVRELSIECRNRGLTLSIANYPPYDFNAYYDVEEQGVFADYVLIMGYDEHYGGSAEAGSVASIDYVTNGMRMTLEKVDASKVINAVPFYARVWKTQNGQVTSEAYGMNQLQEYVTNHNMTVTWNAETGQNYAEATENGVLLQMWMEDNQSIKLKLDAMTAAGVAGVAEWKLDFDTAEVWDVIANYMAQ